MKAGEEAWRVEGGGCPGMRLTRKGSRKSGKPKPRSSLVSWAGFFFFPFFLKLISERGQRNNDEKEALIGCFLHTPYWDGALNPGVCPDREPSRDLLVHRSPLPGGATPAGLGSFLVPVSKACGREGDSSALPLRAAPCSGRSVNSGPAWVWGHASSSGQLCNPVSPPSPPPPSPRRGDR